MLIALWIILAVIGLLIVLTLFAPKTYSVNRNIIIHRKTPEVFNYLKLIKNQDYWSPWKKKDPNMKQEFTGTDGEVGFCVKMGR